MTESHTPTKVLAWATNPVCALYRIKAPLSALANEGSIELLLTEVFDEAVFHKLLHWAEVFIIQRARVDDTLAEVIRQAKRAGVRIVYEIDDDLLAIADSPSLESLMAPEDLLAIERGLIQADSIHVSTPVLEERYAQYGEVVLLPNAFPLTPPPLSEKEPNPSRLRIFYGAGRWHRPDWDYVVAPLSQALASVSERFQLEIDVELMGATWAPPANTEQIRYTVTAPQPWTTYLEAMARADIALMPLEPNAHTDGKSPIKFYEAAAMGTVAVGLGNIYRDTIDSGVTGFCAADPNDFARLVAKLCHNPVVRDELRRNAHQWLRDNALTSHLLPRWRAALA